MALASAITAAPCWPNTSSSIAKQTDRQRPIARTAMEPVSFVHLPSSTHRQLSSNSSTSISNQLDTASKLASSPSNGHYQETSGTFHCASDLNDSSKETTDSVEELDSFIWNPADSVRIPHDQWCHSINCNCKSHKSPSPMLARMLGTYRPTWSLSTPVKFAN